MIGSICNYHGYTWDFVLKGISFQNLIMLSASVPQFNKKEEEKNKDNSEESLNEFLQQ